MLSVRIPSEFPSSAQSVSFNSPRYNLASLLSFDSHITHSLILLVSLVMWPRTTAVKRFTPNTDLPSLLCLCLGPQDSKGKSSEMSEAEIPLPAWPAKCYYSLFCTPKRAVYQGNAGVQTTSFCGRTTVAQVTRGKKEWESRMDTSEVWVQIMWLKQKKYNSSPAPTKKSPPDLQNRGPLGIQVGREDVLKIPPKRVPTEPKYHWGVPRGSQKPSHHWRTISMVRNIH